MKKETITTIKHSIARTWILVGFVIFVFYWGFTPMGGTIGFILPAIPSSILIFFGVWIEIEEINKKK